MNCLKPQASSPINRQIGQQHRQSAFTLIEVVISIGILAMVMGFAYSILLQTLRESKSIKKSIREGRAGDAIVSLMRRDLQGLIYRGFGREVFLGVDNGDGENAEDEVSFLTTTEVSRPQNVDEEDWLDHKLSNAVYSVSYALKSTSAEYGNTLFRRTSIEIKDQPLTGGSYEAIYDRVKAINIRYLDRADEWLYEWDSLTRIPEEEDDEADVEDVIDAAESAASGDDEEDLEEEEPEPLAVPRAVEITLYLFVADETGLVRLKNGEPKIEEFVFVVPLLAGESLELATEFLDSLEAQ